MDIQKLRQEFEKLPDIKGILYGSEFGFNESLNEYYHPDHTNHRLNYAFIMGAWMAWKAQTVPEGFVLVLKVITNEWMATHVNQVIGNYCKDYEDLPFAVDESELPELKENFRLTIRSAHKRLMKVIEAQEQSHDS